MSKELKAFEKITNYKCSCMSEKIECKEIIKKTLEEHEQYKAIEQELGIDLRVLFKALRNNCYVKIKDRIVETLGGGSLTDECKYIEFAVDGKDYCNRYDVETIYFGVKDYGKTWALTKEELK